MITPVATRIEEVLNAQTQYAIPPYQRDFKWGETEARELVEDLDNYRGLKDDQLFLGSFILEPAKDEQTYIIDGQQRLTTLMLLLVACRRRARELSLPLLEAAIQSKLTYIDSATAQSKGSRFVASESIRDIFDLMVDVNWQGDFPVKLGKKSVKRQTNRIRPVFRFFSSRISEFNQEELSTFLRALYDSYVIRISISNDEEAFSVFERTNARGMDLEVADLLKNYLFAKQVADVGSRWNEIVENSDGTLLRMLKYFYVSRAGYVQKPQLYRKLKAYGDKEGATALTMALAEFSTFYRLTKAPSREATQKYFVDIEFDAIASKEDRYVAVVASLEALLEFKISQFVPVAYSALRLASRSLESSPETRAKAIIRLFESLEKYHFVNNVVCERVGNEVERLYADTCAAWATETKLDSAVTIFVNKLREKRASFDEFRGRFADISYSPNAVPVICYIFDRLNNLGVEAAQRLPIYVPSGRDLRRSHNIEHFMPRNPNNATLVDEETSDTVDNIGNLLPLYFKDNSRLGNKSPAQKIESLQGPLLKNIQNLPFVQEFLHLYALRQMTGMLRRFVAELTI
jgi:hypothetical protein